MLTRDEIALVDDLPFRIMHVKEWGGDIKVRAMSTIARIAFENRNLECKNELETMVCLIMHSCVDDNNNRVFIDSDFDLLAKKSAKVLMEIFQIAIELSTLSNKEVEEKVKN